MATPRTADVQLLLSANNELLILLRNNASDDTKIDLFTKQLNFNYQLILLKVENEQLRLVNENERLRLINDGLRLENEKIIQRKDTGTKS